MLVFGFVPCPFDGENGLIGLSIENGDIPFPLELGVLTTEEEEEDDDDGGEKLNFFIFPLILSKFFSKY